MKKNIKIFYLLPIIFLLIIFTALSFNKGLLNNNKKTNSGLSSNNYSNKRNLSVINQIEHKTTLNDFDNITLYHNQKDFDTEKKSIINWIKKGEDESYSILGETKNYPLDIIIFSSKKEFDNSIRQHLNLPIMGSGMYYEQAIYINLEDITPAVFIHEYIHFKTHSFCNQNDVDFLSLPTWFIEGISDYSVRTHGRHYNGASLDEIMAFKDMDKFSGKVEDKFYLQSYYAVEKIIEIAGEKAIQDILIKTKELEFYDAFENIVGMSIEQFETELKKQIKDYEDSKVNSNDLNDEINNLEKYVEKYPNDAKSIKKLAYLYYRNNDFKKAENHYKSYLDKVPNDEIAIHQLALVYEKQLKINEAIALREFLYSKNKSFNNLNMLLIDYLFVDTHKAVETSDILLELAKKEDYEVEHYKNKKQVIHEYYKNVKNGNILKAYYDILSSEIFIMKEDEELASSLIYKNIKEFKNTDELYNKIMEKIHGIQNKYKF